MTGTPDFESSAFGRTTGWKRAILWRRSSFASIFFITFGFQLRSTVVGLACLVVGVLLVVLGLLITETELRRAIAAQPDPRPSRSAVNRMLNRDALGLSRRRS